MLAVMVSWYWQPWGSVMADPLLSITWEVPAKTHHPLPRHPPSSLPSLTWYVSQLFWNNRRPTGEKFFCWECSPSDILDYRPPSWQSDHSDWLLKTTEPALVISQFLAGLLLVDERRGEGRGQSGVRSHLTGATPRDGRSLSGPSWALSVSVCLSVSVSVSLSVDLVWPGVVICNVDCNIISSSLLAVVVAVVAGSGRTTVICLSWDQPSHQPGLVWPCCTHWAWHHLHLMASSVQPGPAPPVRTPSTTSTTSIRGWAELRMSDSQICLVRSV